MKRLLLFSMLAIAAFGLTSCLFAQEIEQQTREVAPFKGVRVSSGISLFLTQGDENQVVVKASEAIIDDVVTKTEDGILIISISSANFLD
jgi:hypothetical protein